MARTKSAVALALVLGMSLVSLSPSPAVSKRTPKAQNGGSSTWTRISDLNQVSIDEVSLVRTADGVLHAFFNRHDGTEEDLVHKGITAGGTPLPMVTVEDNWNGMSDPDSVLTPDGGLRVFFGGIRTGAGDPQDNLNTTVSDSTGATWTLQTGTVATADSAYAAEMGAGTDLDGFPFVSWGGMFVHRGLSPADPNYNYMDSISDLCCGYEPDIAVDGVTGEMYVGWASNADEAVGIWAHKIDPTTGAPVAGPMLMPEVVTDYFGEPSFKQEQARVPITGRVGAPGVYIAYHGGYPFANKILLWKIGDADAEVLKSSDGNINFDDVGIAAAPDGRLWVYYLLESHDVWRVYARRSNLDATKFGTTVYTKAPKNADPAWRIVGNAQGDRLDVVVTATNENGTAHYASQFFPGLSLKADPQSFHGQKQVTFTALDAGDPIEGAVVEVGGKHCTTNANGECKITLGPYNDKKKLSAKVFMDGYIGQDIVITIKP